MSKSNLSNIKEKNRANSKSHNSCYAGHNHIEKLDKYIGAIIGTAIGDALGVPMETMWAADIAKTYPTFNWETCDYVAPASGRRLEDGTQKATWSDDTQLSIPIIESIIAKRCIHPADIAKR